MSTLKQIIEDLKVYRKKIALILVLSVITAILGLVGPYVYKILTDKVISIAEGVSQFASEWQSIIYILIFWGAAEVLFYVFDTWFHRNVEYVANYYTRDLMLKAFSYVQNLSLRFHVKNKSGSVMKKIDRATEFSWQVVDAMLASILSPAISFVAIAIVIFTQSWKLALVAIATIPIYVLITYFITKKISSQQEKVNKLWEKSYGSAWDAMTNIEAVKAYSGEQFECKKVDRQMTRAFDRQYDVVKLWINSGFYRNLLFIASQIGVFGYGIWLAAAGEITVGTIVLFIGFLAKLHAPLYQLTNTYTKMQQGLTAIGRVYALMRKRVEVKDVPAAKPMPKIKGRVKFDGVSFGYDQKEMVLDDINLSVEAGSVIAVVGPSGVGKSTLANLLNRFYDPVKGNILIDGIDIKTVQQRSLREQIGIVTQENILFNETILNNIAYGDIDPKTADVAGAVKIANLEEVIDKLPNRYQTLVGERGVMLSGGEKQRVSIARAVLKDPPILILDEATSHLDSENERLVQEALWKLVKGRTTFIIAHRFSTIRRADKIIVLKDGKIIEQGTHSDLLRQNGLYQELYQLQSSGDITEN